MAYLGAQGQLDAAAHHRADVFRARLIDIDSGAGGLVVGVLADVAGDEVAAIDVEQRAVELGRPAEQRGVLAQAGFVGVGGFRVQRRVLGILARRGVAKAGGHRAVPGQLAGQALVEAQPPGMAAVALAFASRAGQPVLAFDVGAIEAVVGHQRQVMLQGELGLAVQRAGAFLGQVVELEGALVDHPHGRTDRRGVALLDHGPLVEGIAPHFEPAHQAQAPEGFPQLELRPLLHLGVVVVVLVHVHLVVADRLAQRVVLDRRRPVAGVVGVLVGQRLQGAGAGEVAGIGQVVA